MRNYFTFYGFDNNKKETIKLTNEGSKAIFQNNKISENINICEKAKDYLKTGKSSVYFAKQMTKDKKYGMVILNPTVKPLNPQLNNITVYVFGYDIDMEKAKELMDKEFNINQAPNNTISQAQKLEDSKLYLFAQDYLEKTQKLNETQKKIDNIKNVLSTCYNGEVFSNGDSKYAVLIGLEPGGWGIDTDALKKNPQLWAQYSKQSDNYAKITIDNGIKKDRQSKPIYNRSNFSNKQLYDLASQYNVLLMYEQNEKHGVEKSKEILLRHFKEGSTKVTSGKDELVVNIKICKGAVRVDTDKVKGNPAVYEQYKKRKDNTEHFSVVKLS